MLLFVGTKLLGSFVSPFSRTLAGSEHWIKSAKWNKQEGRKFLYLIAYQIFKKVREGNPQNDQLGKGTPLRLGRGILLSLVKGTPLG